MMTLLPLIHPTIQTRARVGMLGGFFNANGKLGMSRSARRQIFDTNLNEDKLWRMRYSKEEGDEDSENLVCNLEWC
jgi:hypothetical protein